MGKKKQKQIKTTVQHAPKIQEQNSYSNLFQNKTLWIVGIIAVTFISYFPVFFNTLIDNWDDGVYITKNEFVKKIDIPFIFSFDAFYGGNYHPFILLIHSVFYHFFKFNPIPYHLINIVLHCANIFLVYKFVELITKRFEIALITALFLGIHPMHVESVAWATELKDVLYTFFLLLSAIYYVKYFTNENNKTKNYIISIVFIVCSLFSKSAAVAFPGIVILLDWFFKRKINTIKKC